MDQPGYKVVYHCAPRLSVHSGDNEQFNEVENPLETWKVIKNLLAVSVGFVLLFTAYMAIQSLQSSINKEAGLGNMSLAVIYATLIASSLFFASTIIKYLGCKKSIWISMLFYGTFIVANFYPTWYTMIPTSALLGFCGATLWVAKCQYITQLAAHYSTSTKQKMNVVLTRFFGIFFMFFQTSQIWGNLITHSIIEPPIELEKLENTTGFYYCGKYFCDDQETEMDLLGNETAVDPYNISPVNLYSICGVFVACCLGASLLVGCLVDDIPREEEDTDDDSSSTYLLLDTIKQMKNPFQLLIIPLTIYSGLEQAFIFGDFTKAFLSCRWGVHNVSLCMICFGVSDAICSYAFVPLMARFGRLSVFTMGLLLQGGVLVSFLYIDPPTSHLSSYYILAAIWGSGDAIWQTQINAFYGDTFSTNREPAFANYRLWESFGFVMFYLFSMYICMFAKIYIMITALVIGFVCYIRIEIKINSRFKFPNNQMNFYLND